MTTAGFILIFILVRIFLKDSGQIVYIVYAINLLGLLYVLRQIVSKAYPSIFKEHYQNIPLLEARRKSTIRTIIWGLLIFLIACIAVAITIHFLSRENALNVINDVIALISLGISIEDEKISNFFKTRAPI